MLSPHDYVVGEETPRLDAVTRVCRPLRGACWGGRARNYAECCDSVCGKAREFKEHWKATWRPSRTRVVPSAARRQRNAQPVAGTRARDGRLPLSGLGRWAA